MTQNPTVTPSVAQSGQSGHTRLNMGYYELSLYPLENRAEVVPVRNVDMHLNVTGMMNDTMGVSLKTVPADSDPTKGIFALNVTLKHPISNPQFTGFMSWAFL